MREGLSFFTHLSKFGSTVNVYWKRHLPTNMGDCFWDFWCNSRNPLTWKRLRIPTLRVWHLAYRQLLAGGDLQKTWTETLHFWEIFLQSCEECKWLPPQPTVCNNMTWRKDVVIKLCRASNVFFFKGSKVLTVLNENGEIKTISKVW